MNGKEYEYQYKSGFNYGYMVGRYEPRAYLKTLNHNALRKNQAFMQGMLNGNAQQRLDLQQKAYGVQEQPKKKKKMRFR